MMYESATFSITHKSPVANLVLPHKLVYFVNTNLKNELPYFCFEVLCNKEIHKGNMDTRFLCWRNLFKR